MSCFATLPLASAAVGGAISPWMSAPFALLLLLIAAMPLTPPRVKKLWEHYYPHISIGLGLAVALYYLVAVPAGGHVVLETMRDYVAFICLIGSLFVVAGGIHIRVKDQATPLANVAFLAAGAVVANLVGTTGASMVLIRPFLRMNKTRLRPHHVVFFIFLVSNVGGALSPVGDPPLFLGFLRGVPFFWLVTEVWGQWLFTVGALLAVFFLTDRFSYAKTSPKVHAVVDAPSEGVLFQGLANVFLLAVVVGAVFLPPDFFIREAVMVGAALASWKLTPKPVHEANAFGFGPVREVALLFAGIFATMMPALGYIAEHGRDFGVTKPMQYYVASGSLSSVLDNAPTYVTFLQLAETTARHRADTVYAGAPTGSADAVHVMLGRPMDAALVVAVSLGAVFFGAMTYIGNGPNFMVKAIADEAGAPTPGFVTYIWKYSLPILLPILLLGGWLFL